MCVYSLYISWRSRAYRRCKLLTNCRIPSLICQAINVLNGGIFNMFHTGIFFILSKSGLLVWFWKKRKKTWFASLVPKKKPAGSLAVYLSIDQLQLIIYWNFENCCRNIHHIYKLLFECSSKYTLFQFYFIFAREHSHASLNNKHSNQA